MSQSLSLPLSGIRILDLTTVIFGPYTTQILADFGADVIKIEAPGGDMTRTIGPARNPGMTALFLGANRNKRSIELDLKKEQAKQALWRLIDSADVFVHNIRPQKIANLGFDPDTVLNRKNKIIYAGLHGYREAGPYGGRPAYDDVIQGESGLAGAFTERDGTPVLIPSIVADKNAALMASSGLLAAIVQQLRTDQGLYLEVSMFEGMAAYTLVEHQYGTLFNPPEGEAGYPRALSPERRPHKTKDGFICMLAYTDQQWRSFWQLADQPELADDSRFATMPQRIQYIDILYRTAGELMSQRTTQEWLELLRHADIPAGAVNRFEDLKNDPQLNAINFFRPYEHPSEGLLEMPDTGFQFDRQSLPIRQHQPRLGEHSQEILQEVGYSGAEIEQILL